uniref:Nudix hydrolase domain-containing protein n=1 Tax=Rhodosorus marinus TaxID=101924 RepID=A0A7S2ZRP0_9RHOD|mmetsp:Transcript_28969/g.112688  ORF Transcript_28969/g.112688 Transcript_28969/m.112688 type:complete len:117 (+) Transcript_28969:268-618(+)
MVDDAQMIRVGLGVFIERGSKFLIGKRIGSHGSGTWGLPGGYLEFGESFEECARREAREETGLELGSQVSVVTAVNNIFEEEMKHTVTIFVRGTSAEGTPKVTWRRSRETLIFIRA